MAGFFKSAATFSAGYGAGYAMAHKDQIKSGVMSSKAVQKHGERLQARAEKIKSYKK